MLRDKRFLHFYPGGSMAENMPVDLTIGLTWVGLKKILEGDSTGRQTICSFEGKSGRITELVLSNASALSFIVGDATAIIPAEHFRPYMNRWVMLLFSCVVDDTTVKLQLEVDNEMKAYASSVYSGEKNPIRYVLGGGSAEFEEAEFYIYQGTISDYDKSNMLQFLRNNWIKN